MRHASIRRCFRGTTFLPSCCCKDAMAIMLFVRSAQYLQVTEPPALRPSLPFLARVGCITTSSKARRESRSIGFCTGITFEARGREWKPRVVQTPERVDISFATNGRGTCTMYMCVAYIVAMHISMKKYFRIFCLQAIFLFEVFFPVLRHEKIDLSNLARESTTENDHQGDTKNECPFPQRSLNT